MVSAYALEIGGSVEEKDTFWQSLSEIIIKIPKSENIRYRADLSGHVGQDQAGYTNMIGRYGIGVANKEGERVLEFTSAKNLAITNVYFNNRLSRRYTYISGNVIHKSATICAIKEMPKGSKTESAACGSSS